MWSQDRLSNALTTRSVEGRVPKRNIGLLRYRRETDCPADSGQLVLSGKLVKIFTSLRNQNAKSCGSGASQLRAHMGNPASQDRGARMSRVRHVHTACGWVRLQAIDACVCHMRAHSPTVNWPPATVAGAATRHAVNTKLTPPR